MDAYLCIVSKREVRKYTDQNIPDDVLTRILQAGRATGNSQNRQRWELVVVRGAALDQLADTVSAPDNVRGCNAAIAIVIGRQPVLDAGRAAQNMMLAAWSLGIGTCPNSAKDKDACRQVLGVDAEHDIPVILSLGYPDQPVPHDDDPDAILKRINRKPLEELVRYIG
jgi:nitroreductase